MTFKLGKVEKRLLTCAGLLVAGTCCPPALAAGGITTAAGLTAIGTMIAGVTGGLVANDIGNITDSLGKNQGILINHDLTKAVGRAIAAIILSMSRLPEYKKQRKALEKVAQVAAEKWEIVVTSETSESKKRYADLTEKSETSEPRNRYADLIEEEVAQRILHPETPVLDEPAWEYLLRDWLLKLAKVELDDDTIAAVAKELYDGFSQALRETLADDFQNGGKAFAKLTLSLFQELYRTLSQQNKAILKELQTSDNRELLQQVLTRLESLAQLQQGTPQAEAEFKRLGQQMAIVLGEVREVKANTVAIQEGIHKILQWMEENRHPREGGDPSTYPKVVVEVQYPPPPTDRAPISPPSPPEKGKTTIGLETIAEIPVWVGRDALVEQLTAKLLAPETPPKVVAIIGQGGIGKTSLAVKLLESVGVQLQPPALTATCPYEKALYFKTYPGTSFDGVADFLLRGLDMETAEPLKTGAEKIGKILEGLTKQRGVLVLDNLEDILHPAHHASGGKAVSAEWGELLHAFVYGNHRSQIILTSREFPADLSDSRCEGTEPDPDLVFVYSLEGIEIDAGVELLRQRRLKDTEDDLRWVSQRVEGHVFLLTQLAAVARGKPGYLRKHPELVTKKAEPILQVQLERQSEVARDLLRRMCALRVATDLRGLTFLRLYEDEWETDNRLTIAASSNQPIQFTDEEISETESIVEGLVDSSLVQMRYDEQKCELFYDLHQVIADFMRRESEGLPQLFQRVNRLFRSTTSFQLPQSLQALSPLQEALLFAFHLGDESKAGELGRTFLNYSIRLGGGKLIENAVLQAADVNGNYDTADGLLGLAQAHYHLGNWNEAEQYVLEALEIARRKNKRESIAAALGQLGSIERNRGNWDAAERLYRQCLEVETELGDRSGMASSWGVLGDIERNRGNWDAAERLYRQSLEVETELGDRSGMAAVWASLGDIERNRGNWDAAERLYRQSLELRTELGDRSGMATSWGVLGDIERNRGNWDAAERLYRQSLELRTELGDRSGMATSWGCLGDIERKRGNWDAAERLFRQCLELRTELGDRSGMATSWGCLGDIERKRGNWDAAERLYRQSLELRTELGDRSGMATSWGCLGENELGKGNLDVAEQYLTEALAQMEELGMTWHIAETNFDLAQLWRDRGNEEIAQQHYQKAHQLYQQLGAAKELERIETEWNPGV